MRSQHVQGVDHQVDLGSWSFVVFLRRLRLFGDSSFHFGRVETCLRRLCSFKKSLKSFGQALRSFETVLHDCDFGSRSRIKRKLRNRVFTVMGSNSSGQVLDKGILDRNSTWILVLFHL